MISHAEAKQIVDSLGLTPAESLYLRAVSSHEGGYGSAWERPTMATRNISAGFGLTGYEGAGSNNWGAEIGEGDAGSFPHVDRNAAGEWYVGRYRRYSSPERGARGMATILLKPNVRAALARGDLTGAVNAQINENNYTGNPPATPASVYLDRVVSSVKKITASTGEPSPFLVPAGSVPPSSQSPALPTLGLGSQGEAVKIWQFWLGTVKCDGWFGPVTADATRAFQKSRGLTPDGIVGSRAWLAMKGQDENG